jgi:hypothetical protein
VATARDPATVARDPVAAARDPTTVAQDPVAAAWGTTDPTTVAVLRGDREVEQMALVRRMRW